MRESCKAMQIHVRALAVAAGLCAFTITLNGQDGFRFRSDVELVTVNATVSDSSGRFVRGLAKDDFVLYHDDQPQMITHFAAERVPVSLGIVLDSSGSMAGEKMDAARTALNRFLYDLLGPDDEVSLYAFNDVPRLLQGWTTNRQLVSRALNRARPAGATALYDAVAEAVPFTEGARHRKKALVILSDGNDTSSLMRIEELKRMIRETEVLVYAIGLDGRGTPSSPPIITNPPPVPLPFPWPPGGGRRWPTQPRQRRPQPPSGGWGAMNDDRVNAAALRDLTDDSGGRTEIVRSASDLTPATASIADELSQQYFIGYPAPGQKDGRWHSIKVEVKGGSYRVRARRGYVAS
jgi:Ca-activated chloride channel family protein